MSQFNVKFGMCQRKSLQTANHKNFTAHRMFFGQNPNQINY